MKPMLHRATGTLVVGVVGVTVVEGIRRLLRGHSARQGAVVATSWALRGRRSLETGAENARLAVADVVSEARERVGEQSPPPGSGLGSHDHQH